MSAVPVRERNRIKKLVKKINKASKKNCFSLLITPIDIETHISSVSIVMGDNGVRVKSIKIICDRYEKKVSKKDYYATYDTVRNRLVIIGCRNLRGSYDLDL